MKKMFLLLLMLTISVKIYYQPVYVEHTTQSLQQRQPIHSKLMQGNQDVNVSLPTNFTTDIVETFLDLIWDVNGNSGHTDLVTVIYSLIPGFGANGDVMAVPIFLLSLFIGTKVFVAKLEERM